MGLHPMTWNLSRSLLWVRLFCCFCSFSLHSLAWVSPAWDLNVCVFFFSVSNFLANPVFFFGLSSVNSSFKHLSITYRFWSRFFAFIIKMLPTFCTFGAVFLIEPLWSTKESRWDCCVNRQTPQLLGTKMTSHWTRTEWSTVCQDSLWSGALIIVTSENMSAKPAMN